MRSHPSEHVAPTSPCWRVMLCLAGACLAVRPCGEGWPAARPPSGARAAAGARGARAAVRAGRRRGAAGARGGRVGRGRRLPLAPGALRPRARDALRMRAAALAVAGAQTQRIWAFKKDSNTSIVGSHICAACYAARCATPARRATVVDPLLVCCWPCRCPLYRVIVPCLAKGQALMQATLGDGSPRFMQAAGCLPLEPDQG